MPAGQGSPSISHFRGLPCKLAVIAGGAAGDHTVTGIEVGDQIMAVAHVAAIAGGSSAFAAGASAVTAGEDTAGSKDIDTGLGAGLAGYVVQVETAAGVNVPLVDAAISEAAGVITIADGAATFALTATDVVRYVAAGAAGGGGFGTPEDLTSEFTVTAANTINNAGGTASTGGLLIVLYNDKDA